MASATTKFVCDIHGLVATTFPSARAFCDKCKGKEVPPAGVTLKEHHNTLKKEGRKI
tara:strand:+ start:452 stop:622 length:171 start_codon:yes stop_codon:yes gene_type:complete